MERQISPDGLAYIDSGNQDRHLSLLCIHGWACQASDYAYLFNELARANIQYRTIAVDLPGHGESSSASCPDSRLAGMVGAVRALIQDLNLDNVVLAGHSMGMRVVLDLWHHEHTSPSSSSSPPRIKGLILLDGSNYKLRKSLFAFDSGDARSKELSREAKIAGMEAAFDRMFSPLTPEEFKRSTLAHLRRMDFEYSDRMRRSFIAFDYERMDVVLEALGRADVPVLCLQATSVDDENQRIALMSGESSPWMRFLQEKVPTARIHVVEHCMHFPHVDQPSETAKRIEQFISSIT
ncbi:Alpha/Beta hydrolase protein [Neohortaea acidophila]|uniref:Alpha/Beta hydrolase protein n=1 Tax=Neohortaea acidophila TaxID=245834 RepID=A0A6A6PWL3_9PEZI|nr:Alpha/Beta hydrolase protein [Neohortaea acidophila]KAF2484124.1 Alpha/Beta hydrolase protein [Neohortaea acidophila]